MSNENRKVKDSVFVDLFFDDETAEENIRSLYDAIHPESKLSSAATIRKIKLDDEFYMSFINDVSFIADGVVFVFGEQQSTINENMPLRSLMYCGRAYEKIIAPHDRYKRNMVSLPRPEFYVFYNGKEDYPASKELRLSDAYESKVESPDLDLVVHVVNINTEKGNEILKRCQVLNNYSILMETVRKYKDAGVKEPYKDAIKECISKGVLESYLTRKGTEVVNMLIAEYDYNTDIKVQREEAFNDGFSNGFNNGFSNGFSNGESKLGSLIDKLLSLGRTKDAQKAATDEEARKAFYREFGIID